MVRNGTGKTSRGVSVLPCTGVTRRRQRFSSGAVTRIGAVALALAMFCMVFDAAPLMAKKKKPPITKTVRGQVLDNAGNGIAGAAVVMTDLTTHKASAIYTGEGGHFLFSGLSLYQDYQFRAHYKGKTSAVRKVSSWDTRTNLVLNLHIPPPKD